MIGGIALSPTLILAALLLVFSALTLYAVMRLIVRETFERSRMPYPNNRRLIGVGRPQGLSLRYKLAWFTIVLVLFVIFSVSIPLFYMMIREQHKTLLKSLWDRSTVLMEGFSASTGYQFHAGNIEELGQLTDWIAAIPEARYVTITGSLSESFVYRDYVLATNDPDILSKIDTPHLELGISVLTDAVTPALETIQWYRVTRHPASEPEFNFNYESKDRPDSYIFYMPFAFRYNFDTDSFRGMIRVEVSMDSITQEMQADRAMLERTILVIAFAVLVLGVIGALLLSSLIIRPIQELVRHVEIIRDTKDKQDLAGMELQISSSDEIAELGNTINEMTQGLALAAQTASELSIGREIQKRFIPLELDKNGNKLSSGYKETPNAVFFGYYAGAEGVSGDYFDYKDLDGRYYAIIKCDVAGKGIPAALIMIQVATMFLNYFKEWKPSPEGMHIERAVYQINGFIETLKFEGRFAAFTLCIFDSETGELHFCNAGDNIIHIYDSAEMHVKHTILPETPAAGALSNSLVESKGGYQVQTLNLKRGDVLLLYTDGIEESKRGTEELGSARVQEIINAVMNREVYRLQEELQFDFSSCDNKVDELIMALISVEKIFRCYYDPAAAKDSWVLVEKKTDDFLKKYFVQYEKYCAETQEYPDNSAYLYYTHLREDEQYDDLTILGVKRK